MSFCKAVPCSPPCLHVGYHLQGEGEVFFQYLRLVVQLVQVEVISHELEADILPVLLPVQFRLLLIKPCQLDTAVHRPSGIDNLLGFEGEIVPPVGHVDVGGIAKIAVPQLPVATNSCPESEALMSGRRCAFAAFSASAAASFPVAYACMLVLFASARRNSSSMPITRGWAQRCRLHSATKQGTMSLKFLLIM